MHDPGSESQRDAGSTWSGQLGRWATGAKALSTHFAASASAATAQAGARMLGTLTTTARFDNNTHRESFVTLATAAGSETARRSFELAEASVRLACGDPAALRRELDEQLTQLQLLADSDEMGDLLPVPILDSRLCNEARQLVAQAPNQLLEAMEPAPGRQPPSLLGAAVRDARQLGRFAVAYPRFFALVGTNVGKLLASGAISFPDIEAFMEGRRRAAIATNRSQQGES